VAKHHTVITGVGRCGTTFLVELLTQLGLDTGFNPETMGRFKDVTGRAGLEKFIDGPETPYIVKSPFYCLMMDRLVANPDVVLDYIIIPMRDLDAAAASRIKVQEDAMKKGDAWDKAVPGGMWRTRDRSQQANELAKALFYLMTELAKTKAKVILLHFPTLVSDPGYLYDRLQPLLKDIDYSIFVVAFNNTVQEDLVNRFNDKDVPMTPVPPA
jgi:hypothetical protein